ncbi:CDF family Co(II)/Ni(II) efflux transporter DmeF [Xanthobacter sp. V4C-4]|uniref:CDF family Co(II)/Ni(II) efflux transporter DmeF n=1 Tax=Xanthobacter cornucopiae TaxID=3119924 RepID=UPI00372B37C7
MSEDTSIPAPSPADAGLVDAGAHSHVFLGANHERNTRRTLWVVVLTGVMMAGEIVAGTLTGSMALLADGFHMATHAGALGVTALAYVYARRHAADPRFSFGTGKVGDLAGFASALVLGLVALGIALESMARLLAPVEVAFGDAIAVAVLGLGVNILSALLLSGGHAHGHGDHGHGHHGHGHHGHGHHGHDHHGHHGHHGHDHRHAHGTAGHDEDNNLRSAYVHVLADALTSVLAIVALMAGRYLGWVWCDPLMGIVGGVVIARWSWSLLRDTASVLLDTTDTHVAQDVREAVEGPGDAVIRDLHVWRVGPQARAAIISVSGSAGDPVDAATIRRRLAPVDEVVHLTVECR